MEYPLCVCVSVREGETEGGKSGRDKGENELRRGTPFAWKVNEPLKEREMLVTPSSSLASSPSRRCIFSERGISRPTYSTGRRMSR